MLVDNMLFNLNENLRRLDTLNQQYSTGKKFQVPSDDPIGASKSLKLNSDLSKVEQYKRNADDALSWMKETESALTEIGAVLHRANELTVEAANGTYSGDDLIKIKEEIDQLKSHLVQVANSTYAGRHIFSGYKTNAPLLDEDGSYKLTEYYATGTGTFKENKMLSSEVFEYNVGVTESIKVNTIGIAVFGVVVEDGENPFSKDEAVGYNVDKGNKSSKKPDNVSKSYLIDVFDKLSAALNGNDQGELQSSIGRIQSCMNQALAVRSEIGAKMNRLELTEKKLDSQVLSVKTLLSKNEDVDMAKVIIDINTEENIYRASLAAGAKIIQPSLVDFLR